MMRYLKNSDGTPLQQRAWANFEVKSVDEEMRAIEGIASTPTPDRMGDIVEPKGAQFNLPLPFLWQHDSHQPIGHVMAAKMTDEGIPVRVKLVKVEELGRLRDRLDEAWQSIKVGLVRGLSIGFAPLEYNYMEETGGYRFVKWSWLELSAVTIPANAEASIAVIKSCDRLVVAKSRPIVRLPKKLPTVEPRPPDNDLTRWLAAVADVERDRRDSE